MTDNVCKFGTCKAVFSGECWLFGCDGPKRARERSASYNLEAARKRPLHKRGTQHGSKHMPQVDPALKAEKAAIQERREALGAEIAALEEQLALAEAADVAASELKTPMVARALQRKARLKQEKDALKVAFEDVKARIKYAREAARSKAEREVRDRQRGAAEKAARKASKKA